MYDFVYITGNKGGETKGERGEERRREREKRASWVHGRCWMVATGAGQRSNGAEKFDVLPRIVQHVIHTLYSSTNNLVCGPMM